MNFFGSLSLSSLGSFDASEDDDASTQTQVDLFKRIQDLEIAASNFLIDRPTLLIRGKAAFTDIEISCSQEFELQIDSFKHTDILEISVQCLPGYGGTRDNFEPLKLSLSRTDDSERESRIPYEFVPNFHNGFYSFTLTTSHGISTGLYVLSIQFDQLCDLPSTKHFQSIRVCYELYPAVRAYPIEANCRIKGVASSAETSAYRFVRKDSSKLLQIVVNKLSGQNLDYFVLNSFDGLVAASRDHYTWSSIKQGSHELFLHPDDSSCTGSYFSISICSNEESRFELEVNALDPIPLTLLPPHSSVPLQHNTQFFEISLQPEMMEVMIGGNLVRFPTDVSRINRIGAGIHFSRVLDDLSVDSYELPCDNSWHSVVYLSFTTKYPSALDYAAKVLASDDTLITIDAAEIDPTHSKVYLSVEFQSWQDIKNCNIFHNCRRPSNSDENNKKLVIFNDLCSAIDGGTLSLLDRTTLSIDDHSLTYGEVNFLSFLELMKIAKACDGEVFYDLGCGSGKAILSCLLSGIRFLRCTGIEILPSLVTSAQSIVEKFKKVLVTANDVSSSAAAIGNVQILTDLKSRLPTIDIRQSNFLDEDWTDGDLIFVSSLCFSSKLLEKLQAKAQLLKKGARIISTKKFETDSNGFELMSSYSLLCNWGYATAYVYRKT